MRSGIPDVEWPLHAPYVAAARVSTGRARRGSSSWERWRPAGSFFVFSPTAPEATDGPIFAPCDLLRCRTVETPRRLWIRNGYRLRFPCSPLQSRKAPLVQYVGGHHLRVVVARELPLEGLSDRTVTILEAEPATNVDDPSTTVAELNNSRKVEVSGVDKRPSNLMGGTYQRPGRSPASTASSAVGGAKSTAAHSATSALATPAARSGTDRRRGADGCPC